ncbi:hypothetical protein [Paenibacillus cremeus]|uniref:Uncharacterized protein n=1 Tax=Paenibacillus cremeus TaxID=2163881 RepID=A0A559JMB3_9BACL|nr:hypothetical protein [Paenibacillus cremeus]TVY01009.1 hypothetical protein FPZ49_32985 [Paenibacillus cremeus]
MTNRLKQILICCSLLLVSGCGVSEQWTSTEQQPSVAKAAPAEHDVLSLNERQMVLLFKALIQIDRKEGLAFTRSQAEALLPIIRKNSTNGELTQTDQSNILAMLNSGQKRFYDEMQERLRTRMENAGVDPSSKSFSSEDRDRMIKEFERERKELGKQASPPRSPTGDGDLTDKSTMQGGGKNVEQQLIELLEARVHS